MNRFKKLACVITVFILVLIFASCQNDGGEIPSRIDMENGDTGILASNEAVDFYFYHPSTWFRQSENDGFMITIYTNDVTETGLMITPNISAQILPLSSAELENLTEIKTGVTITTDD